ncbi:phage portal protein [Leadbetterella byssophila]|uniref:phage portal protein n=1 Tax=Leadbetterella byssophila TaxID=316068 RepID=UPI0039A2FADC
MKKINEILSQPSIDEVIKDLKSGRGTELPAVAEYKRQLEPKQHKVMSEDERPDKKVKVDNSNGAQNSGAYRTEKVNRIALAIQKRIVKSAASFLFGNPVNLIADTEGNDKKEDVFKALKKVEFDNKTRSLNKRISRIVSSATEVAEYWYLVPTPEEDRYGFSAKFKLKCAIYDPLEGNTLYPYFDDYGDLVAFSRGFNIKGTDGKDVEYFETFATVGEGDAEKKVHHYMWSKSEGGWTLSEGFPRVLETSKIPIVYGRQPAVEWEDVQGIIERLETLLSNFADTNDYFASPTFFITGTITGWARKGDTGKIIQGDDGAKAQILSWDRAPESVKLEIETLMKLINTLTQTADTSFDAMKDIGSISGVALKLLFTDAHLKVQDKLEIFEEYLQRRYSVILSFLEKLNVKDKTFVDACRTISVEPEIRPYSITDEREQVEIALLASGNKPFVSQKTTIENMGWAKDAEAEYAQLKEEEKAEMYTSITEPTEI